MAKKTKEELAEERKRRKAIKDDQQKQEEMAFEKDLLSFSEKRQDYLNRRHTYSVVVSDLKGWYEEIDKLTKKSPADEITVLQLETVNDLIDQVKQLVTDDEFIGKVRLFVPAGDNPQYRDVIGVLRRLTQGLQRFDETLNRERSNLAQIAKRLFREDIESLLQLNLKTKFKREDFYNPEIYDRLK